MALVALTISDSMSLVLYYDEMVYLIFGFRFSTLLAACQGIYWIAYSSQISSSYYLLLFTLERFISVRFPLKRATIWTKKRTLVAIFAIPVACSLAQVYHIYFRTRICYGPYCSKFRIC